MVRVAALQAGYSPSRDWAFLRYDGARSRGGLNGSPIARDDRSGLIAAKRDETQEPVFGGRQYEQCHVTQTEPRQFCVMW